MVADDQVQVNLEFREPQVSYVIYVSDRLYAGKYERPRDSRRVPIQSRQLEGYFGILKVP